MTGAENIDDRTEDSPVGRPDEKAIAAMEACINHARDLLGSARAVLAAGHPNIAYHLAALALEETGRRELIGVQIVSAAQLLPPAWPAKHTQDHVQKLFWSFFGGRFFSGRMTPEELDQMRSLARNIHFKRLAGLYVDQGEEALNIPSEMIGADETQTLINFADARINLAASSTLQIDLPPDLLALQSWFMRAADDPETRRQILSRKSFDKLAELGNVQAWMRWLKELFDSADAEARAAAEAELQRSRSLPAGATSKEKWKFRIRLLTHSHSIRPSALKAWNKKVDWIKLSPVSGKKNQLLIDFILRDEVPIHALWHFGWGIARHFVVALNIATMGFWWWRMPEQISRYYESFEDLQTGHAFAVERSPALRVDWGENRALTEEELNRVMACFVALPGPDKQDQHAAYNYYIGGLTFLSLNDIHWQCESTVFGNFLESLKAMMIDADEWETGTPFEPCLLRFLDELFPQMEERDRFAEVCRLFEAKDVDKARITLKEASFMKLFCDAYFLRTIQPRALNERLDEPES